MREFFYASHVMTRLRFGLFEFDSTQKELRREGVLVRLQSQPAQVLACLLEHSGEVVSRDELRSAVWHNDTFVDFERGLNFCIAQIRAALDDDAAEPRFIRTIPKRGYQFIAPVERVGVPESARPVPAELPLSTTRRGILILAGCLLVIATFLAGYEWSRTGARQSPIVAVMRFDNETDDPSMTRFSDAVSDMLVAELTTKGGGHYRVIGNARILRLPRDQRDLTAVGTSLGASYVVLGQVQRKGEQTRVLAHLIHLPEQTHVWVTRFDHVLDDPLALESEVARIVATEFSGRIRPGMPAALHPRASL
jgi:DNA-binding winged helix-turn-helix (wHTH) protein/TolB-like protein